jgi:hypothetical protein
MRPDRPFRILWAVADSPFVGANEKIEIERQRRRERGNLSLLRGDGCAIVGILVVWRVESQPYSAPPRLWYGATSKVRLEQEV